MNSLLATLIELRILIITFFVSGAVHLALLGSSWLNYDNAAQMDGQALRITVTAVRSGLSSDLIRAEAIVKTEKSTDKGGESFQSAPVVSSSSVSQSQRVTESASKSVSEQQPGTIGRSPLENRSSIKLEKHSESKPRTAEVADKPQPETESASLLNGPLYQSHPTFMVPPEPPVYPRLAHKRGIEGQVVLRVDIAADGTVSRLSVEDSSGNGLLDTAARQAVQHWQFLPAKQNGLAVASYVRVPVDFVLENP